MTGKNYNILFVCSGNSARSIMAEAITNRDFSAMFTGYSGGSQPKGFIDPMVEGLLAKHKYPLEGLRSKSWSEFACPGAPPLDFVFTLCDRSVGDPCPAWPGQPLTAHWGVSDPTTYVGNDTQTAAFFAEVMRTIYARIRLFSELPIHSLDKISLRKRLEDIGTAQP